MDEEQGMNAATVQLLRLAMLDAVMNFLATGNEIRSYANKVLYLSHTLDDGVVEREAVRNIGDSAIAIMENAARCLPAMNKNDPIITGAYKILDEVIADRTEIMRRQLDNAMNNRPDDTQIDIDQAAGELERRLQELISQN